MVACGDLAGVARGLWSMRMWSILRVCQNTWTKSDTRNILVTIPTFIESNSIFWGSFLFNVAKTRVRDDGQT
jgi:hypothetical protein